ncbi:hypothetical protein [Aequorivita marisscotiae]|uniref:Uncharacterized protein n=1 Tax=Aequorivita marisscotiae TaxID=3040348 RepID=A0ABY8KV09_9FLAO|nr:hypothetical protein [Aequorivita sp. Ant34-E75]WGF91542.1 hypothetical protein QCQ61_10015 [Aequorivita sp. Ant34-E75]
METIQNQTFQSLPPELAAKLKQLTKELTIEQVFYYAPTAKAPGHLILISGSTKNIEVIAARKWLRNAFKKYQVLLHVLGSTPMRYGYKNGHPFIAAYCITAAKVYQNSEYKWSPSNTWKDFKKRYKKFERDYFYEHDVLMTMNNEFYKLEARTSVFLTYISLYEHHLTYLEKLYIGQSTLFKSVTQRIKTLIPYLPSIEGLFVKENGDTYYLIAQLEMARQAAAEGDEIYINWDMYHAIKEVEEQLYTMVSDRFLALKKRIKCNKPSTGTPIAVAENSPMDKQLFEVVSQINKIKQPEEIYIFHKNHTDSITYYYLLLVGEGIGTAMLNNMQQAVEVKFKGICQVILIAHSRLWIQKNLFFHQDFFKKIMTPENRVFKCPNKIFTLHWEEPYTAPYGDLDYMYRATENLVLQYFVLREHAAADNAEGLKCMFSTALLRAFRTFTYAKLSYRPNHLSARNLWMLCVYAEPNLRNIEYLFEKLQGDAFFRDVDSHTRFHHRNSIIPEEKALVMDEILKVLKNELTPAVEKVGGMGNE